MITLQMLPEEGEVTKLLHQWNTGDHAVEERLFELVMPDLHKVAAAMMRRERKDHSLQATALLNEAYMRLATARGNDWQSRKHFFAVAARAMRRLLIDHARGRGSAQKMPFDELAFMLPSTTEDLDTAIEIDTLLKEIERANPVGCSIVELKFFLGFNDEEAAEALGLSLRTLQRQYGDVRRWLFERLEVKKLGK